MLRRISISLLFLLLLFGPDQVLAQGGVVKWLRYDANISIQQNSGITVREIHEVVLNQGVTSFSRVIPADKFDDISNVEVLQNPGGLSRTYQLADTKAQFTYEIISENNQKIIQLYFPPHNTASTTFAIRYFLVGGLRFYDSGDRFDWRPFGHSTIAPIDTSKTVITLPAQFTDDQVVRNSIGDVNVNNFFADGDKASFITANVPPGSQLEVSVTFPHGIVQGSPPGWQIETDALEFWSPILGWGSLALGFLLLLVCLLAVFGWWYLRIRISPKTVGKTPKYLKSPPSDVAPAVAGALLAGKVNSNHITATLLEMAYHGMLNISITKSDPDSLLPDDESDEPTFEFYSVDQEKAVRPYESSLYGKIFGFAGAKKRQLAGIRQMLFMSVPELKKEIEFEIAKLDYFAENASAIRRQYLAFGGAGILMSLVLALLAAVLLSRFTYLAGCPFLGLAVGAVALMIVGFTVPKRTEGGAKEAGRWEAFKRYLTDMGVKDAAKIRVRFAQFLPYAVAFGIEDEFVKKFAVAKTPAPKWWGKPEERLPDIGHNQAHAWVSSGFLESTPQAEPKRAGSKGVIRRLGGSPADTASTLLKHIESDLLIFLKVGNETFTKAPLTEEDQRMELDTIEQ